MKHNIGDLLMRKDDLDQYHLGQITKVGERSCSIKWFDRDVSIDNYLHQHISKYKDVLYWYSRGRYRG